MRVYSTQTDQLADILARKYSETADVSEVVKKIIERVQQDGDQALYQLIKWCCDGAADHSFSTCRSLCTWWNGGLSQYRLDGCPTG